MQTNEERHKNLKKHEIEKTSGPLTGLTISW
jgi:hypothetical protein